MSGKERDNIFKTTYNLFIIAELEVILDDMILVLFDFVLVKLSFLNFLEVPCNHKLSSGCDDRILLLTFALVKPAKK